MTPYVVNEDDPEASGAQKPKSIMVNTPNGGLNGETKTNGEVKPNGEVKTNGEIKTNGDLAGTPDSLPSRSSVSGKSIIGNGKNGKSGALKRVSFGSSKGSMVETLVYDHQEDLSDLPAFATPPLVNGEEARLHPAKVRVKFFESQQVTQVACTPPSPDVVLDFVSDSMASPISDQSAYARQMSAESGVDNPFRPDGELSREADTIVSLIKEGKPITPVKGESTEVPLDGSINGLPADQTDSIPHEVKEEHISPTTANAVENAKIGANGSTPKDTSSAPGPGVVEVQHGVIAPPSDTPQVERVMIKKKPKCKCCVIQ